MVIPVGPCPSGICLRASTGSTRISPDRLTVRSTSLPLYILTNRAASCKLWASLPLMANIKSPSSTPALAAGPLGTTPATTALPSATSCGMMSAIANKIIGTSKLVIPPAPSTMSLCQAGFAANESDEVLCSSPSIFTYPPRGRKFREYRVPPRSTLSILGGMPTANSSTRIWKSRAVTK